MFFLNSIQGTSGYGPGPRHMGQQNHHQWSEELPQVSSPHRLCIFSSQESSLPPSCLFETNLLLVLHLCSQWLTKEGGCIQNTCVTQEMNANNFFFFNRCLSEPLMTFKLHKDFIMAVSKLWKLTKGYHIIDSFNNCSISVYHTWKRDSYIGRKWSNSKRMQFKRHAHLFIVQNVFY